MSPWMGGFYERLVGVVKSSLKKSLQVRTVNLVQLQTLVAEVTSVVNSRPLTYVEAGHDSLPLTPSQLLFPMRREHKILMPENDQDPDFQQTPSSAVGLIDRWRKTKSILVDFWRSWRSNYLLSLRERYVSSYQRGASTWTPSVGSTVHLKDNLPRTAWKIEKITSLVRSADGKIRSAMVRTADGKVLRRPLKLLYPLEVDSAYSSSVTPSAPDPCSTSSGDHLQGRPKRVAAVRARNLWRQQDNEQPEE